MTLDVGLTGGIAAGKSAVASRLAARGAVLIDADVLARQVLAPGSEGLGEVVRVFGDDVLGSDGALDRAALGDIVFGDANARERLNGIVHPRVRRAAEAYRAEADEHAVVVEDIPLLVETGQAERFDVVVVVSAPLEERMRRLTEDRGMTLRDAEARVAAQATDEQRAAVADHVLVNDGTLEELHADVDALWEELISRA
ncbi:dephospho-CoA kinase [Nesterenkonia aerolata]|uniref:Dephospho-CoA kinase n=1 Tax=Nesterenkonia aerolata TaxID=3074079 RepID=A0ABU2DQC4_9MICC|nr:dephospho-CoA kinase [Nesterenkonia sp. LY-0111]MDR8018570.1 dephospho-CoA kinase [Nesterenkonia sp. LY-0111]